jgi:hypothetical protein
MWPARWRGRRCNIERDIGGTAAANRTALGWAQTERGRLVEAELAEREKDRREELNPVP